VNAITIHVDHEDQFNDYRISYLITFLSPRQCVQDDRSAEITY